MKIYLEVTRKICSYEEFEGEVEVPDNIEELAQEHCCFDIGHYLEENTDILDNLPYRDSILEFDEEEYEVNLVEILE